MFANSASINKIIHLQRREIKYYLYFAAGIFLVGGLIICSCQFIHSEGEVIKTSLSIGGGFVSSLSTLQLKEILKRKRNILLLDLILPVVDELPNLNEEKRQQYETKINEQVGKILAGE
jgi:hypothetical protein